MSKILLVALCFLMQATIGFSQPPNIIYIYADDLGYGDLGSYGQVKIKTPHLDKMAAEGMRFTNHYASSTVCAPSRCMLMTGMHAGHSYIRGNYELGGAADSLEAGQMPLPPDALTIARLLKSRGYRTALIGKWGLGFHNNTGYPLLQGFDYFYGYYCQMQAHNFYPSHLWENNKKVLLHNPEIDVHKSWNAAQLTPKDYTYGEGNDYAPERITQRALAYIKANKNNRFFLYLPYNLPHAALQVPAAYMEPYKNQFNDTPYVGNRGYLPVLYPRAMYAGMVSYLDEQVGLILNQLKQLGLDERTIVFFSSDNGPSFEGGADPLFFNSNGGLRGYKRELYEGGIRMPFIARWPGKIKAGTVSSHLSAQYDMMATLAALTGGKAPATDGISLLPVLLNQPSMVKEHPFLYFEFAERGGSIAIRTKNWKGIKTNMKANPQAPWQLYDLSTDPAEKQDVAAKFPEVIATLDSIVEKQYRYPHIRDWKFVKP